MTNLLINTDSYKHSHFLQYPPKTQYVSSYIESRGGNYDFTLFFGLQMFLMRTLCKPITAKMINEAHEIVTAHGLPFNKEGWNYILNKHGGYLPLKIQAVKEGSIIPTHNVLLQVVNTDPNVPWLTSFIETALLRAIWYPTTVATRSKFIKKIIKAALDDTADNPDALLPFKLHDFGYRGVSSDESGCIGGCAHLVNFMGTDTMGALVYARKYYSETMAGFSIPAAEHSTMTAWTRNHEIDAYRNMLDKFGGPGKLLAVVSDSYDIFNATSHIWGDVLKDEVLNNGAMVVVRPDSGELPNTPVTVLELLADKYVTSLNSKGYKVLPPCIRVIQGDGVNENSIALILSLMKEKGFSAENMTFGMGGELLQTVNRDTLKFAMKASAIKLEGDFWQGIKKSPITDMVKKSKAGRLALIRENNQYKTVPEESRNGFKNLLEDVFVDGKIIRMQNFQEIRTLSNI